MAALARALDGNTALQKLTMDRLATPAGDMPGVVALGRAAGLKKLAFSMTDMRAPGCGASLAVLLRASPTLEDLQLQNCHLGRENVKAMAEGVAVSGTCARLNLQSNDIDDDAVTALAAALKKSRSMKQLILEDNSDIKDAGGVALAAALADPACSLEELQLLMTSIGEDGGVALGKALASNTALKELILDSWASDCGSKAMCAAFGESLRASGTLQKLRLKGYMMNAEAFKALAPGVAANKSLLELDLGRNPIDDAGAAAVADVLRANRTLESISFEDARFTPAGGALLLSALCDNPTLRMVNLRWAVNPLNWREGSEQRKAFEEAHAKALALPGRTSKLVIRVGNEIIGDT